MPVVTNRVVDGAGNPVRNAYVEILLRPVEGFNDAHAQVTSRVVTRTDSNGSWSVNLKANALITPANTYYTVTVGVVGHVDVPLAFIVPNDGGPHTLDTLLTSPPADLPPHASLVAFVPSAGMSSTDVEAAILETWTEIGDITASEVAFTPSGGVSSTDVEAAIVEVMTEVADLTAAEVAFAPGGGMSSTNTQAAVLEAFNNGGGGGGGSPIRVNSGAVESSLAITKQPIIGASGIPQPLPPMFGFRFPGTPKFFPVNTPATPVGICAGPDGLIYATAGSGDQGYLYKIALDGTFTSTSLGTCGPQPICVGPDGNLWIGSTEDAGSHIIRIAPDGSGQTNFAIGGPSPSNAQPFSICAGADGNVWVADSSAAVWKITPTGTATKFSTGDTVSGICAGPDGNLWGAGDQSIIKITPSGTITTVGPTLAGSQGGIAQGADGNIWVADLAGDRVYAVAPDGSTVHTVTLPGGSHPYTLCAGAGGDIWVTANATGYFYKINMLGELAGFLLDSGARPYWVCSAGDGGLWMTDTTFNNGSGPGGIWLQPFILQANGMELNVGPLKVGGKSVGRASSLLEAVNLVTPVALTADGISHAVSLSGTQQSLVGGLPKSWLTAGGRVKEPGLYRIMVTLTNGVGPTTPNLWVQVQNPCGNVQLMSVDAFIAFGSGTYSLADTIGLTQADIDFFVANAGGFPLFEGNVRMPTDATFAVDVNLAITQVLAY